MLTPLIKHNVRKTYSTLTPLILLVVTGCMSQIPPVGEFASHEVGQPISGLLEAIRRPGSYVARTGSQIRQYRLENGNSVYVEPIQEGCLIHWEVNSSEMIVAYRIEGDHCP